MKINKKKKRNEFKPEFCKQLKLHEFIMKYQIQKGQHYEIKYECIKCGYCIVI